jgi:hypothetical protein
MEQAVLTIEVARPVQELLAPLDLPVRLAVWRRLLARLTADLEQGYVRPAARVREWLRSAVIAADGEAAARRRAEAEQARSVDCRRRADGLADLSLLGLRGLVAQAILARIAAHAQPSGPWDLRSADARRADAAADLLLGRIGLPLGCAGGDHVDGPPGGCGCATGAPVPCGADVQLLVPLGAARGTTDEVAEQVGHGPIEPDLLEQALAAAPVVTPVWVDDAGVPVAVGMPLPPPPRDDPEALDALLDQVAAMPPPADLVPRAPDDHPPPDADDRSDGAARAGSLDAAALGAHPPATPGPYRVPARLRRLLQVRRPRCEWPGCGRRAVRCDGVSDLDHDVPWPDGPTCGCNVGPLCRRHHRIKQLGWVKRRLRTAVRWTSPAGRTWTSPSPYAAPQAPVRPPVRRRRDPLDELSPSARDDELRFSDPGNPVWDGLDRPEPDRADPLTLPPRDELGELLRSPEGAWTIELRDPYAWDTDLLRAAVD